MHDPWLSPRPGGRGSYEGHFKELFIRKQINIKFIQCVVLVYSFRKTSLSLGDEWSLYGWITMMISIYFQMVQKKKCMYVYGESQEHSKMMKCNKSRKKMWVSSLYNS